MPASLTSKRVRATDDAEAVELCFARGWTDGLPVVPPTPARVERMLEAARLQPSREITYVAQAHRWADTLNLERTPDSWLLNNVFYDGGGNLRFRLVDAAP